MHGIGGTLGQLYVLQRGLVRSLARAFVSTTLPSDHPTMERTFAMGKQTGTSEWSTAYRRAVSSVVHEVLAEVSLTFFVVEKLPLSLIRTSSTSYPAKSYG